MFYIITEATNLHRLIVSQAIDKKIRTDKSGVQALNSFSHGFY